MIGLRDEDEHTTSAIDTSGHLWLAISNHTISVKPSYYSSCFELIIHSGYPGMIVSTRTVFPQTMRKEHIGYR